MRIVLLNSSMISGVRDSMQFTVCHARTGVASVAAWLRKEGHEVSIIDPEPDRLTLEQTVNRILACEPDMAGMPSYTEEVMDAGDIARELKARRPELPTVLGGYHISALPEECMREFPHFDFGIVGEGELPFAALAAGTPPADVPGIVYRESDGSVQFTGIQETTIPLDDLMPPAWDLYEIKRYHFPLTIELIRCCPFHCVFCFHATGSRARYKSPEKVLDEIEEAIHTWGTREFYLSSNGTFPIKRDHAEAICNGIIDRGLNIRWCSSCRANLLDEEMLRLMHRAGCTFIDIGMESGDQRILDQCDKGIDVEHAEKVVHLCHEIGIETELNFIIGLPFETKESLEKTRQLVKRLRPVSTIANFSIITPFPGTGVFDMARHHEGGLRFVTRDWRSYSKQGGTAIHHDNFDEDELKRFQLRLYMTYYLASPLKFIWVLRSHAGRDLISFSRIGAFLKRIIGV